MRLIFTVLAAIFQLLGGVRAQCYEPNFGTLLGTGDDVLFAPSAMPFAFPLGTANYDSVLVQTNGVVFLTQSLAVGSGTTNTGYSTSATTMVANLRGPSGASPRIAPYWRDLDIKPTNSAGVYINTAIPGRCVITWKRAVHYGTTGPIFTMQLQLHQNGNIAFFYDNAIDTVRSTPIVGVSAGNAIADPGAIDLSAGAVGTSTTPVAYETFFVPVGVPPIGHPFDLRSTQVTFARNALGGYDVIAMACPHAAHTNLGKACGGTSATAYEMFMASGFDLAGRCLRLVPNLEGGYTAQASSATRFVHTVPGLGLSDDQSRTVTLPGSFVYPGGSTNSISVCSNGYIWMDSLNGLADYSPSVAEVFSNPARLMPMWCDGVADGITNVHNVFAQHDPLANVFYVTWNALPIYGVVGLLDVQVAFHFNSMEISVLYGASAGSGLPTLSGWTAGSSLSTTDLGSEDFSTSAPFRTGSVEAPNLTLTATNVPISGATSLFTTAGIPSNRLITCLVIGLGGFDPGIPVPGAPGCLQKVNLGLASVIALLGTPTANYWLNIPSSPAFLGMSLINQSVSFVPGINAAGVIASNAIRSNINAY